MVFSTLPLAGCRSKSETDWHVDFIEPRLARTEEGLEVIAGVDLDPSPAMLEALERGVSITFLVALRASSGEIWLPGLDERRRHRFRISYLSLSRHYQLDDLHNDTRTTYPRLSMLVRALREPRSWSIPLAPDETASLVRARITLDRTRLPSPMRLPTWFEAQWHLDSDWLRLTPPGEPSGNPAGQANDR
ncbi:DUF4390 domain-containing protein [Wenzhouxiangella sp. EGI_FJ10305]|uniref:DUF4390 domain-containing protein n=1 Tax=Wenzhouxiangella sp. EGI_FJ10305 TaxID=3243768 RepID=UPI0035DA6054